MGFVVRVGGFIPRMWRPPGAGAPSFRRNPDALYNSLKGWSSILQLRRRWRRTVRNITMDPGFRRDDVW